MIVAFTLEDLVVLSILASLAGWALGMGICIWAEGRRVEHSLHREHCGDCDLCREGCSLCRKEVDDLPDARVLKW